MSTEDYSDSEFEKSEEAKEMKQVIQAQLEVMRDNPQLLRELSEASHAAISKSSDSFCRVCLRKQRFLQAAHMLALVTLLQKQDSSRLVYALECCFRVPAECLPEHFPAQAASALVSWAFQVEGALKPAWYEEGETTSTGGHI